jgi:hypothetical protein
MDGHEEVYYICRYLYIKLKDSRGAGKTNWPLEKKEARAAHLLPACLGQVNTAKGRPPRKVFFDR